MAQARIMGPGTLLLLTLAFLTCQSRLVLVETNKPICGEKYTLQMFTIPPIEIISINLQKSRGFSVENYATFTYHKSNKTFTCVSRDSTNFYFSMNPTNFSLTWWNLTLTHCSLGITVTTWPTTADNKGDQLIRCLHRLAPTAMPLKNAEPLLEANLMLCLMCAVLCCIILNAKCLGLMLALLILARIGVAAPTYRGQMMPKQLTLKTEATCTVKINPTDGSFTTIGKCLTTPTLLTNIMIDLGDYWSITNQKVWPQDKSVPILTWFEESDLVRDSTPTALVLNNYKYWDAELLKCTSGAVMANVIKSVLTNFDTYHQISITNSITLTPQWQEKDSA